MKNARFTELTRYFEDLGFSKVRSLYYKQIKDGDYLITKISREKYIKILRNPDGPDCHINTKKKICDIQFDIVSQKDMELILKHRTYTPMFDLSFFIPVNEEERVLSGDDSQDRKVILLLKEHYHSFVYKQIFEDDSSDVCGFLRKLKEQRFGI